MTAKTGGIPLDKLLEDIERQRNRYFTGRYMTAEDFRTEQKHILDEARLGRLLTLGRGIAAGLEVGANTDATCHNCALTSPETGDGCLNCVLVSPGVAIDAGGRFLILREPRAVALPRGSEPVALVAAYLGEEILPVPVLTGTGVASIDRPEPSRVREDVALRWVPVDDAPGGDVVLAVVRPGERPKIDTTPRRRPGAGAGPVPIETISWRHGGSLRLGALRAFGLVVGFGRPVVSGVDAETCQLLVRREDGVLRLLPQETRFPKLTRGNRFVEIRPRHTAVLTRGDTLLVRLRCDFLVDAAGEAVSGSFVGGRLPTGAGGAGGVFESWFTLDDTTDDDTTASEGARS